MKHAPTLADAVIRERLRPIYRHIDAHGWLPDAVARARKFVLDEGMSSMLSDLAYSTLMTTNLDSRANALMESLRVQARLPHPITWIEYDFAAKATRSVHEYGATIDLTPDRMPARAGWLCLQHPQLETAFMAIECASHSWDGKVRTETPSTHPIAYQWRCDDGAPPWPMLDMSSLVDREMPGHDDWNRLRISNPEAWLTGIGSYRNSNVGVTPSPGCPRGFLEKYCQATDYHVLGEVASDLRYLWALLATINDLPVTMTEVRPTKGFVAQGRYKRFCDHRVVTLTVPQTRHKRIAQRAVAFARRRAHKVRGHWRDDWRRAPSWQCKHQWTSLDNHHRGCSLCDGRSIWVREHDRGDASLGHVLTDYAVVNSSELREE